jgi:hypothetical protein
VVCRRGEVAADEAPAAECPQGVPVTGDGLVPLGRLDRALCGVARSRCRLRVVRVLRSIRIVCG